MAEFQAEPQKLALLNVDLQNIFVQGSACSTTTILPAT
jgi:hypothetical protein